MAMETTGKELAKEVVQQLITSDEFQSLFKALIADTIDKKLSSLNSKIEDVRTELHEKIESINTDHEKVRAELLDVIKENKELKKKTDAMSKKLDTNINNTNVNYHGVHQIRQERLGNSLRLTGVPESPIERNKDTQQIIPEDTEKVVQDIALKAGITLQKEDLDSARRVPRPNHVRAETPRVIEVRFMRHNVRQKFLSSRRNLKGTGIGVHEVLTKLHQYIYDQAKDMVQNVEKAKTAWTWNGITTILVENNGKTYKHKVRAVEEIKRVAEKYS